MSDYLRLNRPYGPWNSLGQNTGVGSCSLLQGIFPTQGSNPGPLHCRRILYQLSHKGNSRILEWLWQIHFDIWQNQYNTVKLNKKKKKNTGVGSLSLLQRMLPTQESNRGLLHCKQILYQLSNININNSI